MSPDYNHLIVRQNRGLNQLFMSYPAMQPSRLQITNYDCVNIIIRTIIITLVQNILLNSNIITTVKQLYDIYCCKDQLPYNIQICTMICVLYGHPTTILKMCFVACNFVRRKFSIVYHYVPVIYLTELTRVQNTVPQKISPTL